MSLLTELYNKTLAENEKNIHFWEDYLKNLKSLDFDTYAEKLKVPILVPIGSRILFRGELKHTNEVTVALGADYFAKCSLKQAEVLRQHRIKDAESKLDALKKEKEYLENQVLFGKQNIFKEEGQEIVEVHTDDEDQLWREKHRENIRKWKQKEKENQKIQSEITDEELWNRLEELELQEELENELMKEENESTHKDIKDTFVVKEEVFFAENVKPRKEIPQQYTEISEENTEDEKSDSIPEKKVKFAEPEPPKINEKSELLQKVIDKQTELEKQLLMLKNKDRGKIRTEKDLVAKLDEMEELEELEDEMERLEDMIEEENVTSEEELEEEISSSTSQPQSSDLKRKVSFADQDDSETLELTFYHSNVEPCKEPYNAEKGITKPSDIYEVFSNYFNETTSILKKSKYEDKNSDIQLPDFKRKEQAKKTVQWPEEEDNVERRTIVVGDVVEKVTVNDNKIDMKARPSSLFKQRRQQKKT